MTLGATNYIGASIPRREDPRFLMARTPYVDDIRLPGAVHAAFVRSPYPHAEIQAIHTDRATAHEGVRQLDAHHVPVFILASMM